MNVWSSFKDRFDIIFDEKIAGTQEKMYIYNFKIREYNIIINVVYYVL
jgi:hypothetical protein